MASYEHWQGQDKHEMILDLVISSDAVEVEGKLWKPEDYFLSGAHGFKKQGEFNVPADIILPDYLTAGR